jgi:N-acylneuraminate cytidylyltransferase
MSSEIFAIIPARGGSKGVPKKNIRLLSGHPLIAYSIAVAKLSSWIDRIIVSTDSEEIVEISRFYGAEVPFIRPQTIAGDKSPDRDFVLHALNWFTEHENKIPGYLVHLRPTTPLRIPQLVDEAIEQFLSNPNATSLRSGHETPESPFKWFMKDEDGYFYNFAPDNSTPGYFNSARQNFPSVYIPDGYVDVLSVPFVLNSDDIHGKYIMAYVSPSCHEVDVPEDFEYLEFQLKKTDNLLLNYLNSNFRKER